MLREENCIGACKALQRGESPQVSPECVEGLLQWLCGRQHGTAESPRRILGDPSDNKRLVQRVYGVLDDILFLDNSLAPIKGTFAEKERRYRLLVRAFHPDRFPELEKWLIPRSQSVNAAYAAFRNNLEADEEEASEQTVETHQSTPPSARPHRMVIRRPGMGEWLLRITAPLSRSRYLPQKIMAVIVILCTLLLVIIYYTNRPL